MKFELTGLYHINEMYYVLHNTEMLNEFTALGHYMVVLLTVITKEPINGFDNEYKTARG